MRLISHRNPRLLLALVVSYDSASPRGDPRPDCADYRSIDEGVLRRWQLPLLPWAQRNYRLPWFASPSRLLRRQFRLPIPIRPLTSGLCVISTNKRVADCRYALASDH